MERKKLLFDILKLRRKLTFSYQKYLSTPREYYPGEEMYMREVHFIIEIGERGIDNVGELSERLEITKGAVSQYLKKLEEKGFIQRSRDGNDKRQFSVSLTEKGRELYRSHTAYDRVQYARACALFSEFTEEELKLVHRFDERFEEFTRQMLENGLDKITKKNSK